MPDTNVQDHTPGRDIAITFKLVKLQSSTIDFEKQNPVGLHV